MQLEEIFFDNFMFQKFYKRIERFKERKYNYTIFDSSLYFLQKPPTSHIKQLQKHYIIIW